MVQQSHFDLILGLSLENTILASNVRIDGVINILIVYIHLELISMRKAAMKWTWSVHVWLGGRVQSISC